MKKLNDLGSLHFITPILIVVVVALAGSFMLVASHADSPTSPVIASSASKKCKSRYKLVNAKPTDYISGRYKSKAIRGNGLLCLKNADGREVVSAPNTNTIRDYFKCSGNTVFAADDTNPDGTGYVVRWKVKSWHGDKETKIDGKNTIFYERTYYCIKQKELYAARAANGAEIHDATSYMYLHGDFHNYKFYPAFKKNAPCAGDKYRYTGCKQNYFFSYYGDTNIRH